MARPAGRIVELWRYPVKSMLGEQLDAADIGEHGISGDRSFALIDVETGKVCSAKRHDLWGGLFTFRASMSPPGPALVTFPDGTQRLTDDPRISEALSDVLGRPVRLSSTASSSAGGRVLRSTSGASVRISLSSSTTRPASSRTTGRPYGSETSSSPR
jgi:hypothetical protein